MADFKYYKSAKIVPFQELLERPAGRSAHKGGVIWDDWDDAGFSRHCRASEPVDDLPDWPDLTETKYVPGTLAWCGAIVPHFGHQVADFSTRIPLYRDLDVQYCFAQKGRWEPPAYFWEILSWFQVKREKVLIVDSPTLAEQVVVAPQQEQIGGQGTPPSKEYLSILDRIVDENGAAGERKSGVLYVSRAGLNDGLIAGELYLERLIEAAGVRVLRPETVSLREQLMAYSHHEKVIFTEGSALHGLQLLGENIGQLHVLKRRPGPGMIKNILQPRVASLCYHDIGKLVCPYDKQGRRILYRGITIPDVNYIEKVFQEIGLPFREFAKNEFDKQVLADVNKWVSREEQRILSWGDDKVNTMRNILSQFERLSITLRV